MISSAAAIERYRKWVAKCHEKLFPYFDKTGEYLLEETCVALDVHAEHDADLRDRGFLHKGDPEHAAAGPTRLADLLLPRTSDPARADAPRWVVVGEPGSGKTTLGRSLARTLAKGDGAVPIFVTLARWGSRRLDPIEAAVTDSVPEEEPHAREALRAALTERASEDRGLVVMLDGLDEVEPKLIDALCARIEQLALKLPRVALSVSTRPVALEQREHGLRFPRARVEPLDGAQRDRFVQRDRLLDNLLGPDAERVKDELRGQAKLAELGCNPLMLTLIAFVARDALIAGQPLPTSQSRLFHEAIELFLRRGYGAVAEGVSGVKDKTEARRVLRALSFDLQEQGGESWTQERLSSALTALRKRDGEVDFHVGGKTWANNDDFLTDIGTNAGVVGPHDGPREPWRYLHRSLREFLAAESVSRLDREPRAQLVRQLAAEFEAHGKLSEEQRQRAPDPSRWAEVWGLLSTLERDPRRALDELATMSASVTLRALPAVESIPGAENLARLFKTAKWDFAALHKLLRDWRVPPSDLRRATLAFVEPALSLKQLAYVWWALERVGAEPDAREFFAKARPKLGAPPVIDWVAIPAGKFAMGSKGITDNELPVHSVTVRAFELARTTVTRAQFRAFDPTYEPTQFDGVLKAEEPGLPATDVDWWRALLFCKWVAARLPSEAEWECACRAGTTTAFSFGDDQRLLGKHGWYFVNSGKALLPPNTSWNSDKAFGEWACRPHAVAAKRANAWALHDMHGNVWEWCEDTWHENYKGAPSDGTAWVEEASVSRVLRGGCAWFAAESARSAYRHGWHAGVRREYVGFRAARFVTG